MRAKILHSPRLRALRQAGNSHRAPSATTAALAASPGLYVTIGIAEKGTTGRLGPSRVEDYRDREPQHQPWHEPVEPGDQALKDLR